MKDIKIDLTTFNLVIENGDLVIVEGAEEIRQSLTIRLYLIVGLWFLDGRLGVDYFGKILKKNAKPQEIQTELRRVISETIGVTGILSYKQEIRETNDKGERTVFVNFTVSTIYNENITIEQTLNLL